MSVFNENNTAHQTGDYPLFLGQKMGLYDSITQVYPQLFDLYKLQKQQDWNEDEVDLSQSRQDFETCGNSTFDVMIQTLMWQWEADSVASQSIISLFSPFISNSELFGMMMKQSEIEVLHALTYSDIVRQCLKNPRAIIQEVMDNQAILDRSGVVVTHMRNLETAGANYRLGVPQDEEELRCIILRALFALLGLEGLEFISSFACTFALAEQGLFLGIAQLVQKIMLDEILHTKMDFAILDILLKDPVWRNSFIAIKDDIKEILDEFVTGEEAWSDYLFSGGRAIIGLNPPLLKDWTYWNAAPIYDYFGIEFGFNRPERDPLSWMDEWMHPEKQQNANQEQTNTDYKLNATVNDDEGMDFDF